MIQNHGRTSGIDGGWMKTMETVKHEVFDIFCDLVRFWSPSGREAELSAHIHAHYFSGGKYTVEPDALGNLMASPVGFKGRALPLICSHMDVHEDFTSDADKERLKSVAHALSIEEGSDWLRRPDAIQLGADDKVGVALCLYVARHTEWPVKILLTVQEECGRLGVAHALHHNRSFFDNTLFALVLDRHSREGNDIIHRYRGRKMAPDAMLNAIEKISAGIGYPMLRTPSPRCADAYNLACHGIPAVNLSSGIHNEHSRGDTINIQQAVNTLRVVMMCIALNDDLLNDGGTDDPVDSRVSAEV